MFNNSPRTVCEVADGDTVVGVRGHSVVELLDAVEDGHENMNLIQKHPSGVSTKMATMPFGPNQTPSK